MGEPAVRLYYLSWCGYCRAAKRLLEAEDIPFTLFDYTRDHAATAELKARTGHRTMPQVFHGDRLIGGYTELAEYISRYGADALKIV
jgi:glutaredoxin